MTHLYFYGILLQVVMQSKNFDYLATYLDLNLIWEKPKQFGLDRGGI